MRTVGYEANGELSRPVPQRFAICSLLSTSKSTWSILSPASLCVSAGSSKRVRTESRCQRRLQGLKLFGKVAFNSRDSLMCIHDASMLKSYRAAVDNEMGSIHLWIRFGTVLPQPRKCLSFRFESSSRAKEPRSIGWTGVYLGRVQVVNNAGVWLTTWAFFLLGRCFECSVLSILPDCVSHNVGKV